MLNKLKLIAQESQAKNLHIDLIRLFLNSSMKSILANGSALIFFIFIYHSYIVSSLFIGLVSLQVLQIILRLALVKRYKDKEFIQRDKETFVKQHIYVVLLGGITWGISGALCLIYAPSPYEYIMAILLLALAAGTIATLSSIYCTYIAFNISMLSVFILALFYSGTSIHVYMGIILCIFTYIVMKASYDMHKELKSSIELKDLYQKSQEELKKMNTSLEHSIVKEVEENRQKDKHMLEQSRLAQMGEMLSMIAHQWRQPLSAIAASTSSMSVRLQLEESKQDFLFDSIKNINDYTQYLSTTINDFRDFFKPNKEKIATSLNEVVLGSLHIIGNALQSQNIIIETYLDDKIVFQSYPNELRQVVLNLLKNAQDVFLEKDMKEPKIIIKTINTEDHLILEISDNAGGIPDTTLPHVFDPYFTTKEKEGTGLGLYMSKLIIDDHCKGNLSVDNKNKGACFCLKLPRD